MKIPLIVNDRSVEVDAEPSTMLVDVLRDRLGLTGPRAPAASGCAAPAPCCSTASPCRPAS